MSLKYYTAHQNNSGGYFIQNNDVRETVIIQANNVEDALKKLEMITEDYSEYCPCCGERWSEYWDDEGGTEQPMIYGENVYETSPTMFRESAIIYHADGRKEIVVHESKGDI